jgi:hypothetical protein
MLDTAGTDLGPDDEGKRAVRRTMLKSKIHRATVTQADLHYVGSITVDADLMAAADLLPGEQVQVVDINNGARLETYVIEGPAGSGVIGLNGAAARRVLGTGSDPAEPVPGVADLRGDMVHAG